MLGSGGGNVIQVSKGGNLLTTGGSLIVNKIPLSSMSDSQNSPHDNSMVNNNANGGGGGGGGGQLPTVYPIQYITSATNIDSHGHIYQGTGNSGLVFDNSKDIKPCVKQLNRIISLNNLQFPGPYQDYSNSVYSGLNSGQYYHTTNGSHVNNNNNNGVGSSGAMHHSGLPNGAQLITTNQGSTIILQGTNMGNGIMQDIVDNLSLPHHTRASPVTVQWLTENYENADGVSLPRSTLYCHYVRHCQEQKLDPMNPASFGKLIRSVFAGLRTRRLGTRGNSKYHYYGIRIKPSSMLNQFVEDKSLYATRNYPNFHKTSFKTGLNNSSILGSTQVRSSVNNQSGNANLQSNDGTTYGSTTINNNNNNNNANNSRGIGNNLSIFNNNGTNNAGQYLNSTGMDSNAHLLDSNNVSIISQSMMVSALPDLRDVCDRAHLPSRLVNRIMGSENRVKRINKDDDRGGEDVDDDLDEYEEDEDDDDETPLRLPGNCSDEHVIQFVHMYADHCDRILQSVVNLNFDELEGIWREFWQTGDPQTWINDCGGVGGGVGGVGNNDKCGSMPRVILYSLVESPTVQLFIAEADHSFYQSLVEVLIPDVFKPHPQTLTQAIRNFAKCLEMWMRSALTPCKSDSVNNDRMLYHPPHHHHHSSSSSITTSSSSLLLPANLIKQKVGAVCALAHVLRRYTSLNHLAQAARAVLVNSQQIAQMLSDLNRIDFNNIQEQASLIFHCRNADFMNEFETEFKRILQRQSSLEEWGRWLEQVVLRVLADEKQHGKDSFVERGQQFILKWSYYSSLIIRDLTLRSASSFGSFHLIRLLYDEYIYYLVEHQIAIHDQITPVASISNIHFQKMKNLENNENFLDNDNHDNATGGDIKPCIYSVRDSHLSLTDNDKNYDWEPQNSITVSQDNEMVDRMQLKMIRSSIPTVTINNERKTSNIGVENIINTGPRKTVVVTSIYDEDVDINPRKHNRNNYVTSNEHLLESDSDSREKRMRLS